MKFAEVKGDLFSCNPNASLAHCISEDCRMGKGIAVHFKNKFGGVAELQQQVAKGAKTGSVAVLLRDGRFVYYLITKVAVFDKPTYATLQSSLEHMKQHAVENQVDTICMPRIGCGLDGLAWNKVAPLVQNVFNDTDISIMVYSI